MNGNTEQYYDDNAQSFINGTISADVSDLRNRFLKYIPAQGCILDWGCGSGRDTIDFLKKGYVVDAIDGSREIAKLASEAAGILVKCEKFDQLDAHDKYDGIWACASILHVKKDELINILKLANNALKPGGVIYASFKYGDFFGERNGRYFTDMTYERFADLLGQINSLTLEEHWITSDVREGRESEKWINFVVRRKMNS